MMSYFVVDVETDGPVQGLNSIVCFGAVLLDRDEKLNTTFYGEMRPLTEFYEPSALAVSQISREKHETFNDPTSVMLEFNKWVKDNSSGQPILLSDNNGFDAAWINWYFHTFLKANPFGWSSRRIGDMFAGFFNDPHYRWKKHRKTKHTHNPIDDAKGNAEALIYLKNKGFKIKWK